MGMGIWFNITFTQPFNWLLMLIGWLEMPIINNQRFFYNFNFTSAGLACRIAEPIQHKSPIYTTSVSGVMMLLLTTIMKMSATMAMMKKAFPNMPKGSIFSDNGGEEDKG